MSALFHIEGYTDNLKRLEDDLVSSIFKLISNTTQLRRLMSIHDNR
jgi:hypothetical protein